MKKSLLFLILIFLGLSILKSQSYSSDSNIYYGFECLLYGRHIGSLSVYHWENTTIYWKLNLDGYQSGGSNLSTQEVLEILQQAFSNWESLSGTNVSFIFDGYTTAKQADDGINVLCWDNLLSEGWGGQAFPRMNGTILTGCDIVFNIVKPWRKDCWMDLETVATHEIGHMLGLDDICQSCLDVTLPSPDAPTMYIVSNEIYGRSPERDDIEVASFLFGGNLTENKTFTGNVYFDWSICVLPNKTFTLNPNTAVYCKSGMTIDVDGYISSQGNSSGDVTITSQDGMWEGFTLSAGSNASFNYTIIGNAEEGVRNLGTDPSFDHALIYNCDRGYYSYGGQGNFTNSSIRNNSSHGSHILGNSSLRLGDGNTFGYTTIHDNGKYGIYAASSDNTIYMGNYASTGRNSIYNNNWVLGNGYQVYLHSGSRAYAENCYWNSCDTNQIAGMVYGNVDFIPIYQPCNSDPNAGGLLKSAFSDNSYGNSSGNPTDQCNALWQKLEGSIYEELPLVLQLCDSLLMVTDDPTIIPHIFNIIRFSYKRHNEKNLDQYIYSLMTKNNNELVSAWARITLSWYYLSEQNPIDAIAVLKDNSLISDKAIRIATLFHHFMIYSYYLGDKQQADQMLQEMVQMDPENPYAIEAAEIFGSGDFKTPGNKNKYSLSTAEPTLNILNYPNPFNSSTIIRYNLPDKGKVIVTVFDMTGRQVDILCEEEQSAGMHELIWNGIHQSGELAPSGIYFFQICYNNSQKVVKKALFLK